MLNNKYILSIIVAMDKNNLIGNTCNSNGMPWHYPDDLDFYKSKTINKINVMGRVTYDKIGKALPNRTTIVLTKNKNLNYNDAIMAYSVADVIDYLHELEKKEKIDFNDEIMLIGGVEIFDLFFEYVDIIYLTKINKVYNGDVYYNSLNLNKFKLISNEERLNGELEFKKYKRID